MHDPEFDPDLPEKLAPTILGPPRPVARPGLRSWLERLPGWPIPRRAQAVFAESFRQAIVEGLAVDHSIRLAAEVNPSGRFRAALLRAAVHVRAGDRIESALAKAGAKVSAGLKAALRVGEEHGCLAGELSTFARRAGGLTMAAYFLAIGRRAEAIDFASALSRLLRDQRLTVRAIRAAGEVASAGNGRFLEVVDDVARRVEDGESLPESLARHPNDFDRLFCVFLREASSREAMRACLDRLAEPR